MDTRMDTVKIEQISKGKWAVGVYGATFVERTQHQALAHKTTALALVAAFKEAATVRLTALELELYTAAVQVVEARENLISALQDLARRATEGVELCSGFHAYLGGTADYTHRAIEADVFRGTLKDARKTFSMVARIVRDTAPTSQGAVALAVTQFLTSRKF